MAVLAFVFSIIAIACKEPKEHTADAIREKDSVAVMSSYGVNTLISDSGVVKYRLIAEQWDVNQAVQPNRWFFLKGLFMVQFDEKFQVSAYVQCDTAYYYNEKKLWELRGRVRVNTTDGLKFRSEELFRDDIRHKYYSNMYSYVDTPERSIEGAYFESDEYMKNYRVTNTKGSFEQSDMVGEDTLSAKPDSVKERYVPSEQPRRRVN